MWSLFEIRRICCVWKPSFDLFWICLFVSQWRRTDWLVQPLNEWTTSTAFAYIFSTRFFWYESIAILLMLLLSLTFSFSSFLSLPIPLSLSLCICLCLLLFLCCSIDFSGCIKFFKFDQLLSIYRNNSHHLRIWEHCLKSVHVCIQFFMILIFIPCVFFEQFILLG